MQNLKNKTINGVFWNSLGSFSTLGIQFVVGIILARILNPTEFGLIGMLTVFIALSQSIIDSGFSSALIRKKTCSQTDYSTAFIFNLSISVLIYFGLFFLSSLISKFYNQAELEILLKVLGFSVILNALSIIQSTKLTREINFKLQTQASVFSALFSGIIALIMAYNDFGVWSLVALTLSRSFLNTFYLWLTAKWMPNLKFSKKSFNDLFAFGSKLLISGMLETIYRNIYLLIIGKYFSSQQLGYFTRADQFSKLPILTLISVINKVSYPVLSKFQDNNKILKAKFKVVLKSTMFVVLIIILGLAAISESLIITLVGLKWLPSVVYLQLLCFVGIFYPINILNLNILQVKGRSDIILKLEVFKKILAIPIIIIGIMYGVKALILGMILDAFLQLLIHCYYSGRFIDYNFFDQIRDISPFIGISIFVCAVVYVIGESLQLNSYSLILITQIIVGVLSTIIICEVAKIEEYTMIKELIINKILNS